MNNNWNLKKLEKQASGNQEFDDYVLNISGILKYQNLNVLDIGCSNGFKTKMLFDKYDNITHINGIDIDDTAINEAKEEFKNNSRYNFELKSIDDLHDENKYDIINLSYVLQHLENPEKILANLKKKLTDRGIIIIKVPDDSFKFCYPDPEDLLHKIFNLYESQIMVNQNITKNTDIIISATGVKNLIKEDMVGDNTVIVDVGITRENGKLYGDVDFDNVSKKASLITPVPGGVGPMTIASLAQNILKAYKMQKEMTK